MNVSSDVHAILTQLLNSFSAVKLFHQRLKANVRHSSFDVLVHHQQSSTIHLLRIFFSYLVFDLSHHDLPCCFFEDFLFCFQIRMMNYHQCSNSFEIYVSSSFSFQFSVSFFSSYQSKRENLIRIKNFCFPFLFPLQLLLTFLSFSSFSFLFVLLQSVAEHG